MPSSRRFATLVSSYATTGKGRPEHFAPSLPFFEDNLLFNSLNFKRNPRCKYDNSNDTFLFSGMVESGERSTPMH